jgi:hypothetical protein
MAPLLRNAVLAFGLVASACATSPSATSDETTSDETTSDETTSDETTSVEVGLPTPGESNQAGAPSSTGGSASTSAAAGGSATISAAGSSAGAAPARETRCPAGSLLTALTPSAGTARYGTVFGNTLYQNKSPSSYQPQKLTLQVTRGGGVVPDCAISFTTDPGNGWVFPDAESTDEQGKLSAYWTAGNRSNQVTTAGILLEDGSSSLARITGTALPSDETRSDSIHFRSSVSDSYTEYEVQVTPLTAPPTTYYETQGWQGAYGGIQFNRDRSQVIFSVWNVGAQSAELRDRAACNQIVAFSGEGSGTSCRLSFPPSAHGSVPGLPSDYMLRPGDTYKTHLRVSYPSDCGYCTDYSFDFTDVTRGFGPISLGTQRYMAKAVLHDNDVFVEDWSSSAGDDCISAGARSAYFHDMRALVQGVWQPVQSGSFSPNFVPDNNEICANYFAGVDAGRLLLSSGGDSRVGPPAFGESSWRSWQ